MDVLKQHFPGISNEQAEQLILLHKLLTDWNQKVNLVSRKDENNILEHHILHSLSISAFFSFLPGTSLLDVGTGGGLPGLPLAVFFPQCRFHLIDSTGKKIMAVKAMIKEMGLKNVTAEQTRLETHRETYQFIVSRAVASLPKFWSWMPGKILDPNHNHDFPNGIIYLKGGHVNDELREVPLKASIYHLNRFSPMEYFSTKKILHLYG